MTLIEPMAPTPARVGAIGSCHEAHFAAMGTMAHVVIVGGTPALLDVARTAIETLESRWSRFRPTSEICRINANAGLPVAVSDATFRLVERAVHGWQLTHGRYDPTVLNAMEAIGYDRTFDEIGRDDSPIASARTPGCVDIRLDRALRTVTVPIGCGLDVGGIGKGFAADLVVNELREAGALGVCVNLGGDVRVDGEPPGARWSLGIADPRDPGRTVLPLDIEHGGAVVTTTSLIRRWQRAGREVHHLIDPRTGLPADEKLVAATVVAGHGWLAEVFAKAAFLSGPDDGAALLAAFGLSAVLFLPDSTHRRVGALAA